MISYYNWNNVRDKLLRERKGKRRRGRKKGISIQLRKESGMIY